ncbi:site-2 protease family protein [Gordonia hydrophobica]|uniref:Site-2 protease family protein n=1 Tax=Gordonia hydrophobica TaxID=40516 RepID=A0ABZ2U6Z9_9ACTN|nr:site-2 protease family protein [Gordonia hydrophobica]MBM7366152.1 Zn-dependent protease [Gordonia hydrophobica]
MTTPTAVALKSVRPGPVFAAFCIAVAVGGYLLYDTGADRTGTAMFGAFLFVVGGWMISLSLHEFAHAFTAFRYGDRSVEVRGYLTLDPRKYTHAALSIVLPLLIVAMGGIGFPGGAVYLNTAAFTRAQRSKVSLAGPATNLALGVVLLLVLRAVEPTSDNANLMAATAALAFLQLTATLLNILPVPGFDGYGAIEPYLSHATRAAAAKIAPFGFLVVFVLLFVPALNRAFFSLIYAVFDAFGVNSVLVAYGLDLFAFWL